MFFLNLSRKIIYFILLHILCAESLWRYCRETSEKLLHCRNYFCTDYRYPCSFCLWMDRKSNLRWLLFSCQRIHLGTYETDFLSHVFLLCLSSPEIPKRKSLPFIFYSIGNSDRDFLHSRLFLHLHRHSRISYDSFGYRHFHSWHTDRIFCIIQKCCFL